MILVSSCLAGLKVRYNGTHSLNEEITILVEQNKAITICPELLGGFSTPREPAEIIGGNGEDVLDGKAKVIEKSGKDVTELYIKGAYATLNKAREVNAAVVVLKEYSPSCGSSMIYNGEFIGKKLEGMGVTSALLKRNGFTVISEEQFAATFTS
ncbi:2-thiouracil desulfurase family protein [Neobacillus sp. Marseille-QA0830]